MLHPPSTAHQSTPQAAVCSGLVHGRPALCRKPPPTLVFEGLDETEVVAQQVVQLDAVDVGEGTSRFLQIVLRNSLPGVLSAAIFTFLLAWNDYLVALVFLRSDSKLTLPMGMQSFFQQNSTDWGSVMAAAVLMMIPPILVFTVLNRYFSVGGIGGSLAGR
nr:ABC transporter permease subunit [Brachybacterium halotolerans]